MSDLLKFLQKYSSWLLFAIYVTASCVLLFTANPYQHHVYLSSASAVSTAVYETSREVTGYFALRDINDDLQRRNSDLELEIYRLKEELRRRDENALLDTMKVDPSLSRYSFIIAHVINNSTIHPHNYITINKGALDGIRPEMGVMDQNGIVGVVNIVGDHSARLISLLNPYLRISCKVKGQEHVGSLTWDGHSPDEAILEELPSHAVFNPGDTIVTSGYSSMFPEGVPVGTVVNGSRDRDDDNFFALRVKLFTDFTTLSTVRVIVDSLSHELSIVEKDIDPIPSR
ncbi:MAG: rod shape-determining protein MreC [Bacteroides sp.]|nr:rod shape-determining protein MreC [Bacteroidales bacterium]MBD5251071.1 rod shape-determining protein MreC [Barnesiella sp.]MBD5253018.1 rod shape-determining protein MreC [Barnesiella sp.]MBD5369220.1 rod shape-determining protein MreC [Bacteroides sp.]